MVGIVLFRFAGDYSALSFEMFVCSFPYDIVPVKKPIDTIITAVWPTCGQSINLSVKLNQTQKKVYVILNDTATFKWLAFKSIF